MTLPHVEQMEMAVIGAVIDQPDHGTLVFGRLPIEQFSAKVFHVVTAVYERWAEKQAITPELVMETLRQQGRMRAEYGPLIADCVAYGFTAPIVAYVDALADLYAQRRLHQLGARVQQMVRESTLHATLAYAQSEIEAIVHEADGRTADETVTLADILAEPEPDPVDWLIPDLLPASDRLLITAAEGGGKSVLLRQFALSLALGVWPFEPTQPITPQRALLIDAENSRRQVVTSLRRMYGFAARHPHDGNPSWLAVESKQGGLDLCDPLDQGWFMSLVREHRPKVVCIGPLYRLVSGDLTDEAAMRCWQRVMEPLLEEGVSIVMEHHAPHAIDPRTGLRVLRPIGSSVLQRWFSQGVGIRTKKCERHEWEFCRVCPREGRVEMWRGSRDETRWPSHIKSPGSEVWWLEDLARE